MANYIIGDLQGCFEEFDALLAQVQFHPKRDTLWLCGDLVARGEDSLQCLRKVIALGDSAKTVLGNHDLHLLATAAGFKKAKPKDKVQPILDAEDSHALLHWLSEQPLLLEHEAFVITHAGIPPQWDIKTAKKQAQKVSDILRSERKHWLLENMYGNQPDRWQPDLSEIESLRFTINALTRMRFCYPDGTLDAECKFAPDDLPKESPLAPWFELADRKPLKKPVVFGHWAALNGKFDGPEYGLDTGCVWGNVLTMLRWEDKQRFTQPALR
ncbi:bis(5'-nucleosyl)-tetraphosphatase (symmetrical) ApaH [Thaumasiovibrio subtropicus]|uniref:bis(5'-nucleosyl)-tetraphosphatase (symmetrical) ApaH n=1 Tax=Thaumasiovibrio subtropicus TaxID=1891207 RepID=UPI000B364347|nr:bis(5'-nucleosyl)-tetraphosphatase (symmetrical) ApaH [Thaumasiovibrio subtropicus]